VQLDHRRRRSALVGLVYRGAQRAGVQSNSDGITGANLRSRAHHLPVGALHDGVAALEDRQRRQRQQPRADLREPRVAPLQPLAP